MIAIGALSAERAGMTSAMTATGRRVAIVEDHGALRIFLRDVLTRLGWEVTGVAGTAEAGRELIETSDPDVAVVDLHLASEGGGESLIRALAESPSHGKVVVFTATTDPRELNGVLEAGADGIVLKEGGLPELLAGLEATTRGERYVSPSLELEPR
jgi:DNA-binding NarL/FixJ family response regulator